MLWRLLALVEQALNYEGPRGPLGRGRPELVVVALALLWASLTLSTPRSVWAPLTVVALFHALSWHGRVPRVALLSLYPALLTGGVALLVTPYPPLSREWLLYAATVGARVYGMASATILVVAELGPHGGQRVAARLHPLLHDSIILFYRLAPQTVEDALVAAHVQGLLGGGARDALAAVTLSSVRRAELLRATLYARGAGPGRRSPLPAGGGGLAVGVALTMLSAASLIVVLLSS